MPQKYKKTEKIRQTSIRIKIHISKPPISSTKSVPRNHPNLLLFLYKKLSFHRAAVLS